MIAALYVATNGVYYGLPDVDPYDINRDARRYKGPHPVVAHPPCERWGAFSTGGLIMAGKYKTGDDGGCFSKAIECVRAFGGVLEHPARSKAFRRFGLGTPRVGVWTESDDGIGHIVQVDQGHFGHAAKKPTWLYAVGCNLPALPVKPSPETWRNDPDKSERWKARAEKDGVCVLLSKKQRAATPVAFRDLLIKMAESSVVLSADDEMDSLIKLYEAKR